MNKQLFLTAIFNFFLLLNVAFASDNVTINMLKGNTDMPKMSTHITTDDSVRHMVNHPAFKGFGKYLLPWDNGRNNLDIPLRHIGSLLPYHSHVNPDIIVTSINHMINEVNNGRTIFYDFYTESEKKEDPSKISTGLFFFKGSPGAPFAVLCPGGGFAYVGSLHEGFPHAVDLSRKGYNTFVLRYRPGSGWKATQDLAAAISFIFKNTDLFEVSPNNYSLWGSSAGARMVGDIAYSGLSGFDGYQFQKPRVVVIAYTGHTSISNNYPPTFIMVSEDDPIVDVSVVDRRVEKLKSLGIEVVYQKYNNAGHGFGLGIGTTAEGWLDDAVRFWKKH